MAKSRDFFDDEPLSRNNEPRLSHSLENGPNPNLLGDSPKGKRRGKSKSKKGPWYKHPEMIKGIVAGVVVLVLVFVILVFQFDLFGGSSQPKNTTSVQPPVATPQAPAAAPEPVAPTPPEAVQPTPPIDLAQPNQTPPVEQPEPTEKPPAEPEKPPLPENVADWKPADYFRARRENDPKLPEAVAYLGRTFVGSKPTAEGLTNLLRPLPPEKPAEPAPDANPPVTPGMVQPPNPEFAPPPGTPEANFNQPNNGMQPYNSGNLGGLVEAIIGALGNNGTDTAKKTIEQVLAGTFKTDDDKVAVEAALKALLSHPDEENDALMLRALTKPDALRPTDRQGPWPPKDLQAKAFELAKASASSGLRKAMADALVDHNVRLNTKDPMHAFLLSPNPLNCEAQLVLYLKAKPNKEVKTTLEDQFLDYGAFAMARLLGIPSKLDQNSSGMTGLHNADRGQQGGLIGGFDVPNGRIEAPGLNLDDDEAKKTDNKSTAEIELARRIADSLWSKQFLALLEPRLTPSAMKTFDKQPNLIMLAGTIPMDSTRSALSRLFSDHKHKQWEQGPKALEAAGLDEKIITDPGLLTVIKMVPRRDHKTTTRGASRGIRPGAGGSKLIEDARKKQETEQEWLDFSYKMVASWCKRFHAAAQARAEAAEAADAIAETPSKLPEGFALSSNARVVASYHLSWPDAAPAGIAKLNPGLLEVYYVRIEEMNTPRKATGYYKRQANSRSSDVHTVDKITWLDTVRIGSEKDRRRSLDVVITPPDGYVPADKPKDESDTNLVIEILVIEIKNPNG